LLNYLRTGCYCNIRKSRTSFPVVVASSSEKVHLHHRDHCCYCNLGHSALLNYFFFDPLAGCSFGLISNPVGKRTSAWPILDFLDPSHLSTIEVDLDSYHVISSTCIIQELNLRAPLGTNSTGD